MGSGAPKYPALPQVLGFYRKLGEKMAGQRALAGLHFAMGPPQVLTHIVFTDSQHSRDLGKRKSLNLLQDKHVPAGWRKQEGPEHGQLERSAPILAWYDAGIVA